MKRIFHRNIIVFSHYFKDFKATLDRKVLKKIYEVFIYIMSEERIPSKFFKNITSYPGLYEIRVEYEANTYRIFCCLDKGNVVVLFNGFQNKSQKAPDKEIQKALRIMKEYQSQNNYEQ